MNRTAIIPTLLVAAIISLFAYNVISQRNASTKIDANSESIRRSLSGQPHLTTCQVCKEEISSAAKQCPNCGDPR